MIDLASTASRTKVYGQIGRFKTTRTRLIIFTVALLAVVALCCLTICFTIISLGKHHHELHKQADLEEDRLITAVIRDCQDEFTRAMKATAFLMGFVMGSMQTIPPLNGTVEERQAGQSFGRFMDVTSMQLSEDNSLVAMITAPGGAFAQCNPKPTQTMSIDYMKGGYDPMGAIESGRRTLIGPESPPRFIPQNDAKGRWVIRVRQPIYNVDHIADRSPDNFWGFVFSIISIDEILEQNEALDAMEAMGMRFIMFINYTIDDASVIIPIFLSDNLAHDILDAMEGIDGMQHFIHGATIHPMFEGKSEWFLAVQWDQPPYGIGKTTLALIVVCTVAGSAAVLLLLMTFVVASTATYDGKQYAPRQAPFALLTVGLVHADHWWSMAADEMVSVFERLNDIGTFLVKEHKAYRLSTPLLPHTATYVLPSVGNAVRMAFDVIEELQRNPVDECLRELLGENERLLMTYAVHWCTDATVTEDKVEDALLYAGPDVAYAGRMWVFSSPNTVTLSEAAKAEVTARGHTLSGCTIVPLRAIYLLGVAGLQSLYTIIDVSSTLQQRALEAAHTFVSRRRQGWRHANSTLLSRSQLPGLDQSILHTHSSQSSDSRQLTPLPGDTGTSLQQQHTSVYRQVTSIPTPPTTCFSTRSPRTTSAPRNPLAPRMASPRVTGFLPTPITPSSPAEQHQLSSSSAGSPDLRSRRDVLREVPTALCSECLVPTNRCHPLLDSTPSGSISGDGHPLDYSPTFTISIDALAATLRTSTSPSNSMSVAPVAFSASLSATGKVAESAGMGYLATPSCELNGQPRRGWVSPQEESVTLPTATTSSRVSVSILPMAINTTPNIPAQLDATLRTAFERHGLALPTSYDSARVLVFYFYTSYMLLFWPLTPVERTNLQRRLSLAFGVPLQDVVVHLAACCSVRYLQQSPLLLDGVWQPAPLAVP